MYLKKKTPLFERKDTCPVLSEGYREGVLSPGPRSGSLYNNYVCSKKIK